MKSIFFFCIIMVITSFSLPAQELCGRGDLVSINNGEYIIQNNVWFTTTTAQCLTVNGSGFTITTSDHNVPTSGSAASYPCIYKDYFWLNCSSSDNTPIRISEIQTAITTWSTELESTGVWNTTSQAWFRPYSTASSYEELGIKIWINHSGNIQPEGSIAGTTNIGGHTWEVWHPGTGLDSITYRITSPRDSISLDYKSFIDDAVLRGYIQSSWYLVFIRAGFEIWNGGTGLRLKSFQSTVSQNLGDVDNNGTVDIIDALKISQYYVGLNPSDFNPSRADVDCNGSIDILDALKVSQYYVGLISSIC